MTWKEYQIDDTDIAEWVSWGGIVKDSVMENKDHSFFSVIQYEPNLRAACSYMKNFSFKNGWNIWSEKQNRNGDFQYFLVVSWNPDYDKSDNANNTLSGQSIHVKEASSFFEKEVESILKEMSTVISCRVIMGQEFLDFLTFTLSLGEHSVSMPDTTLFLDALLTQDLKVSFLDNGITINEKNIMILTLPSIPEMPIMDILYRAFSRFSYRHVQRMLLFGKDEAKEDLEKYISKWCGGRKSLKDIITDKLLSNLNGYYSGAFIFLIESDRHEELMEYCQMTLNELEIPYLFEEYNLKDVWWGSLPGMFRANITAPIVGIRHLEDLLAQKEGDLIYV
jgi:hypothetical protein